MIPLLARVLADENTHPGVMDWLRSNGADLVTVFDRRLAGKPDHEVLAAAIRESRTVLTHDRDFGRLAILQGQTGGSILYIRPGNISAEHSIRVLKHVIAHPPQVDPPLLVVARSMGEATSVRVRQLPRPE